MPPGSSGRRLRCSSLARSRLACSSGSSCARRLQRSTPPAASRRAILATSWGQVSQNVVGNGSPDSSNGACSVTAGRPYGQRTATCLNARGFLPSWRSTISRSSTRADRSPLVDPPGDALDDEEPLAGPHEPDAPRLALERLGRVRLGEASLEVAFLRLERANVGHLVGELLLGAHVAAQRARVEERHQQDPAD